MKYSYHVAAMNDWLEIRCPIQTSLADIEDMIVSQVVEKCGTQLKAAYALGITPETISRRLNRHRKKLGRLANSNDHETGAGDHASDPLPPGGRESNSR